MSALLNPPSPGRRESEEPSFYYGGQAVIEGVMMRGQSNIAVAVRRRSGEIALSIKPLQSFYTSKTSKLPLLRGIVALAETLFLAVQILLLSADLSQDEEEKISAPLIWAVLVLALILGIGLFFIVPLLLVRLPFLSFISPIVSNLVEGVIRLGIFLLYLWAISLLPEARRIFAYHGAEHKVINAYEQGAPLEPEAVKKYSASHLRCGTSFLLIIVVLSILVFAFLGNSGIWLSILSRLLLLPLLAALSYEITRLSVARARHFLVRALLSPGLALQALTTREPDDSQIEVAISALQGVREADKREGELVPSPVKGEGEGEQL